MQWGNTRLETVYPADYIHRSTGLKLPDEFQTWNGRGGLYALEALARKLEVDPAVGGHRRAREPRYRPSAVEAKSYCPTTSRPAMIQDSVTGWAYKLPGHISKMVLSTVNSGPP